jgi:hypothetical protein
VHLRYARSQTDVFSLRTEPQGTRRRQTLWQRGLSGQVMRNPASSKP